MKAETVCCHRPKVKEILTRAFHAEKKIPDRKMETWEEVEFNRDKRARKRFTLL